MSYDNANEIIPRIWIGDRFASQDDKWLRENGIQTVFNCTKDIPFHSSIPNQYRVPVDDNLQPAELANMERWSSEIAFKLYKEYQTGNRILVHCYAGRQRSATVVALFLLLLTGRPLIQVLYLIQSRRSVTFRPRINFADALRSFERTVQTQILNERRF